MKRFGSSKAILVRLVAVIIVALASTATSAQTEGNGAKIAIMGGTFLNDALSLEDGVLGEPFTLMTKLGESAPIFPGDLNGVPFYYIHMHGSTALQASWVALYDLGVKEVIGGATAGGINPAMQPYDYVIPHDFIDMNTDRPLRFPRDIYRESEGVPLPRVNPAMDPDLRTILLEETRNRLRSDRALDDISLHKAGVIIQPRGGRFETVAEIKIFAQWGSDVVTMNLATEIAYARMLGMNYACIVVISNPAEGVAPWDFGEIPALYQRVNPISLDIIAAALPRVAALGDKPRVSDSLIFHPEMTMKPEEE
ncbi:MAG: hypothetical protein AB8F65_07500 [Woeseiaceae bacterium]